MFPYIILIALVLILYVLSQGSVLNNNQSPTREKCTNKHLLTIGYIFVTIFSAIRYDVGWDYMQYYNTIVYGLNTNMMSNNEYLTIFLINISRNLNFPFLYFALNSAISVYFIAKVINRYSKNPWLSLLIYICFPLFYLNSFSVIRMFTALAITTYAFRYVLEKKLFKYSLCIILASMFHASALFSLVLYLSSYIRVKTSTLTIIVMALPLISNIINSIVINYTRYGVYTNQTRVQEGTRAIVVILVIFIISMLLRKRISKDYNLNIIFNSYTIGLMIYLMFLRQGTMGHRLSLYGTIFMIILVPNMLAYFHIKSRIILTYGLVCAYIFMYLWTIMNGATYIPYNTVFDLV
ncbi:MAG: EpsG family protein [Clostridiales bacterium]|nr:EpsG family protein [Clostridiales bacterium]